MKKYYEVLGLDMAASIEEVEQAYKELSETWNPQTYQNLPRYRRKAEIRSKEINEAYERISAYLMAKPPSKEQDADHTDPAAHDGMLPESEAQIAPAEESIPSPVSKTPRRKTLFYGLIAIALVLIVLFFYQISNRKKPAQQAIQTASTGKEQPASGTPSRPATTAPRQKETEAPPAAETTAPTYATATDTQNTVPSEKIDYNALLTEAALDKYNRNPARVKRAQKGLIANGYDAGPLDGIIGPYTTDALRQFARDHALEVDNLFASDLTDGVLVYAEVASAHPDWHSIIGSDDFAHWLDRQSYYQTGSIQNLKKSATAQQVIDILNRYKSDRQ